MEVTPAPELTIEQQRSLSFARAKARASEATQTEQPWYSRVGANLKQGLTDFGQAADDIVRLGANAATLGLADRFAGYMSGEGKESERAKTQEARDRAGWAGTVTEVGGTALPAVGLVKAGASATRLIPEAAKGWGALGARSAAMGADGAAIGAAEAVINDRDVAGGAATGALAGYGGNLAGTAISKGVGKVAGAFGKNPELNTVSQWRKIKDQAYKSADESGVIFTPQGMSRLATEIKEDLAQKAYDPDMQGMIAPVLRTLDEYATGKLRPSATPPTQAAATEVGAPAMTGVTMTGLDTVRKKALHAAGNPDPTTRKFAYDIVKKIDDFIDSPQKGEVFPGSDAEAGAAILKQARQANHIVSKLDRVGEAADIAQKRAAKKGMAGNIDERLRDQFERFSENKRKMRGFTPDEKEAVGEVASGTGGRNFARLLGRGDPISNPLIGSIQGLGGTIAPLVTGNPLLALPAIGQAASGFAGRKVAEHMARNDLDDLVRIIRAGGNRSAAFAPPNAAQRLAEEKRGLLGRLYTSGGILGSRPEEP
jgi:hypothetical protein